jgi:hypothetical protein
MSHPPQGSKLALFADVNNTITIFRLKHVIYWSNFVIKEKQGKQKLLLTFQRGFLLSNFKSKHVYFANFKYEIKSLKSISITYKGC